MPKISTRGLLMPESPIRKLAPYAEEAKKKGREVIHLNIGQPDIKSPEVALDAIRNFKPSVVEYSHTAGYLTFRKGLSEYYQKIGIDIDHKNILVTTGGSEAVTMALNSLMDELQRIFSLSRDHSESHNFYDRRWILSTIHF